MSSKRETDLIDAMVAVIRNQKMDPDTARLAATVISVDAHFNARVANLKKQQIAETKLFQLLAFSDDILDDVREIAAAMERGVDKKEVVERLAAVRNRIATYEV
jgi:hypothetical protein